MANYSISTTQSLIQFLVDGEEINNLISVKTKKTYKDEEKESRRNTDDYVLEKLFKSAGIETRFLFKIKYRVYIENLGVHSALKHDVIMKSSNPDYSIVEVEAERLLNNILLVVLKLNYKLMK